MPAAMRPVGETAMERTEAGAWRVWVGRVGVRGSWRVRVGVPPEVRRVDGVCERRRLCGVVNVWIGVRVGDRR